MRLWEITDRTARTWLNEAVEAAASEGVTFSIPVTLHTFRHSYAMHMLYAGTPLKAMQSLLGHKSAKHTEIYTRLFALDVAARHRVQFQMPGNDAVAMLRMSQGRLKIKYTAPVNSFRQRWLPCRFTGDANR